MNEHGSLSDQFSSPIMEKAKESLSRLYLVVNPQTPKFVRK